jgi:hypothetical protein
MKREEIAGNISRSTKIERETRGCPKNMKSLQDKA